MLILLACLGAEAADVHLTHTGRVLDGTAVAINGSVDLELTLYPSADSTVPLWDDTLPAVLQDGHYAVVLGTDRPLDSEDVATEELWLAVSIDNIPISPRQRIGATPRAVYARSVVGTHIVLQGGVRRWSDGSVATSCRDYRFPADGFTYRGATGSGVYAIDPDGTGPLPVQNLFCDMTTAGGGWTIVYASGGGDGEVGIVSNTPVAGDPLTFAPYNLSRANKAALVTGAEESLFLRSGGAWLIASKPMFTARIAFPENTDEQIDTLLTASDGSVTSARMGWSNFNTSGGGDFGITTTAHGFDLHSSNYYMLNSSCEPMYLYSHSGASYDGDANYRVNLGLGSWTVTDSCNANESGSLAMYAAVR